MADELKILGQSAPNATTETDLYTVPDAAQTTTSSLIVCNRGATGTFRVSVSPLGVATSNEQYLYYDEDLAGTTTHPPIVIGMTLAETDVVRVYASTSDFSFNLFGVETT